MAGDPKDSKPQIEEDCKPKCSKEWMLYKACEERIKDDTTGDKHCTPQYFRFWACVDKCAAKKVFWSLK